MSKIKKLAGDTILYGLGSIVPRFINFLLVTLHTKVFQPEAYSVITKVFAYTAVVNTILLFGMETAYFRFATKDGLNEKRVYNLTQTIVICISLPLTILLILFSGDVASLINLQADYSQFITWLALIMFTDALVAIPFARLRLQKKALLFAFGRIANILLLVGLNVYFLILAYNESIGIGYVLIANLLANFFYIIFFFRILLNWRPAFEKNISGAIISYGYPIMITGLAGMTNEMFSRVMLEEWLPEGFYGNKSSEYALGVFGACYKLAVLMSLAVTAFRYAAEPFFFSNAADKNSPQLFARVNHYFVIVCCVLLLGVGINLDIFKYFLGDTKYWEGLHIVPVLLLAYLFLGIYYNFSVWFKLTDKTYWGTIISILGAVITILANFFLIPLYGYEGSSVATLICYFSMTAICFVFGQRYYPIPYNLLKSGAYIAGTVGLVYFINSIRISNTWLALSFHAGVTALYILIIFLLERKELRKTVR
jgi:O-antigen/teichoic acid export membrane protein